jgi:hypothetical protein
MLHEMTIIPLISLLTRIYLVDAHLPLWTQPLQLKYISWLLISPSERSLS